MFFSKPSILKLRVNQIILSGILMISFVSCSGLLNKEEKNSALARVGQTYLYKEDVAPLLTKNMSPADSTLFISNYINKWASKQLLVSKAKINLSQEKIAEYNQLVEDYRTDLYTGAYMEALVAQTSDSLVTDKEMSDFYEQGRENFRLKERIARIRFVALPVNFLNKDEVSKRLRSFKEEDVRYLDSIGVQFNKLNFNDSIWVRESRIFEEIPVIDPSNADKYLKNSQFFELQDSLGVYLGKIEEIKDVNDIAPLSFISPTIKQVLLSRRKLNYLRKLETELLDEAIKDKEFQLFNANN